MQVLSLPTRQRSVSTRRTPAGLARQAWYTFPRSVPVYWLRENPVPIEEIGVVGCGLMGSGIAQVAAQAGLTVLVSEASPTLLDKGLQSIERNLARMVEKGALTGAAAKQARARLRGITALEDFRSCGLIIEAIIESLPAKRELFSALDALCPSAAIFASNTSSVCITEMAFATKRPDRFLGLHFFNPVPVMKLVELIRTAATAPAVLEEVLAFVARLGKTPVRVADRPGFIVNRLLIPYLLDAVRALEEGLASVEDMDTAMKLGCGYPMGPFTLLDFVGLDTTLRIAGILFGEFHEPCFAPPPLLKRMVLAGWNGRKAGRGFYDYSDPKNPRPVALL